MKSPDSRRGRTRPEDIIELATGRQFAPAYSKPEKRQLWVSIISN
jgi:hypothetical protein